MAYVYTLDPASPADTDLVSDGAAEIREFKNAVIERLETFFNDIDNDPLQVKAAVTFLGNFTQSAGTAALQAITGTTLVLSSNASVGGTFGVTGNSTFTGTINSQTISAAANFTGSVTVANGFTVSAGTSALQTITGTTLTLTSNLYAGAAGEIGWTGRASIKSSADGIIEFYNDALNGFTRLCFGGTTSSFGAIQRNGTSFQLVKADDSGYVNLTAATFIAAEYFENGSSTGVAAFKPGAATQQILNNGVLALDGILPFQDRHRGLLVITVDNGPTGAFVLGQDNTTVDSANAILLNESVPSGLAFTVNSPGTANRHNLYYDAADNRFELQNTTGATRNYRFIWLSGG